MLARPHRPLRPFVVDALWLAHRAACGLAAIVCGWMVLHGERGWLLGAVAFGFAAGAALIALNARLRAQRELVLRDRLELITRRLLSTDDQLVIRGTPAPILPGFLIVVWFFWYAPAAASGLSMLENGIGLAICPLLLLLWMRGARWLFPPILVLDRAGLSTRALGRVQWQSVSNLWMTRSPMRYAPDMESLVVNLVPGRDPRGTLSWWQRYVRGVEAGAATVPLRNTTEDRLLIRTLAQTLLRAAKPPETDPAARMPARFAREDAALLAAIRRATEAPGWQKSGPAPRKGEPELEAQPNPVDAELARMRTRHPQLLDRHARSAEPWPHGRPAPMPARRQWLLAAAMLTCLVVTVFGIETRFFPSAGWNAIAFYVALLPALAASTAMIRKLWPRIRERGRIGAAFFLVLLPLMMSWATFGCALPDLYTRFAGAPFSIEQSVSVTMPGGRRCRNQLHAPILGSRPLKQHICVNDEFAVRMVREGKAVFSGRESWFGRHVDGIRTVEP